MLKSNPARLFLVLLALLLALSLFIRPAHPHFEAEALFGFWPLFGLLGGLALAVAAGAMLGPLARLSPDGEAGRESAEPGNASPASHASGHGGGR